MLVIIVGVNRVDYCEISKNDLEKHFLAHRGQLYKVMPDGLTRMITVDSTGKQDRTEDEAVIIYPENGAVPYHKGTQNYGIDDTFVDIDEHKMMPPSHKWGKYRAYFRAASRGWRSISTVLPLAVGLIVCAWALFFN